MNQEFLSEISLLSQSTGFVLVATASRDGTPHLSVAESLSVDHANRISVLGWYCPGTIANLKLNRNVSFTVWNPDSDKGFQITGELVEIRETGMLDGFAPQEETAPVPQVQWKMRANVKKITTFHSAPHSDLELI